MVVRTGLECWVLKPGNVCLQICHIQISVILK